MDVPRCRRAFQVVQYGIGDAECLEHRGESEISDSIDDEDRDFHVANSTKSVRCDTSNCVAGALEFGYDSSRHPGFGVAGNLDGACAAHFTDTAEVRMSLVAPTGIHHLHLTVTDLDRSC